MLAAAGAATGDVFLGLLQAILAVIVPNGTGKFTGIEHGVQVDQDGEPVVFYTHGTSNVFWSRAVVAGQPVCTITLLLAIFASVQDVPFVCVHPIGSYILGRGGSMFIMNSMEAVDISVITKKHQSQNRYGLEVTEARLYSKQSKCVFKCNWPIFFFNDGSQLSRHSFLQENGVRQRRP